MRSIGTAKPRVAVAVAHALGLPIERTLQAVYRAPATLLDDVPPELAERLCALLVQAGLSVEVVEPPVELESTCLFDVAVHLLDPAAAAGVADAVADFCACDTARALTMLTTPPGVVLGSVGAAAVEAFRSRLPADAAEVVASNASAARYVLIYAGSSPTVAAQLAGALRERGIEGDAAGAILATDLSFEDAEALWTTFGRTGALRIVNSDFLRFDIWLEGRRDDVGSEQSRAAILHDRAGIPHHRAAALMARTPFVLEEGISHGQLEAAMSAYAGAGLQVRAELTTFQSVAVEVVGASDSARLSCALRNLGLGEGLRPPFVTGGMPSTQARIARAVLEAAGAEAYFAEAACG